MSACGTLWTKDLFYQTIKVNNTPLRSGLRLILNHLLTFYFSLAQIYLSPFLPWKSPKMFTPSVLYLNVPMPEARNPFLYIENLNFGADLERLPSSASVLGRNLYNIFCYSGFNIRWVSKTHQKNDGKQSSDNVHGKIPLYFQI